jgi:hypothetical protein
MIPLSDKWIAFQRTVTGGLLHVDHFKSKLPSLLCFDSTIFVTFGRRDFSPASAASKVLCWNGARPYLPLLLLVSRVTARLVRQQALV